MISEEKKAYNRKYYLDNKERLSLQNKKYREEHRDHLIQVQNEAYYNNKDKYKESQKEYRERPESKALVRKRLLEEHGWTQEMYDSKFVEQEGLCAICKMPSAPLCHGGKLAADHEHVNPPKPRGLLCQRCNTGLGQFLDNPVLLIEAITYLAKYALGIVTVKESLEEVRSR